MKGIRGFSERLVFDSDLPSETLPGNSIVEVFGDKRVLIENHYGVSAYSRCEVCVKIPLGTVRISGSALELMCMTKHQLVVCGRIEAVTFFRGTK